MSFSARLRMVLTEIGDANTARQYLTFVLPLSANLLSIFVLLLQSVCGGSFPRGKRTGNAIGDDRHSRAPRQWHDLILHEALLIFYALVLVITSCDLIHRDDHDAAAYTGVLSWAYLLLLWAVKSGVSAERAQQIRAHSISLYTLHWLITAVICYQSTGSDGALPWTSPLEQGFVITTVLFVKAIVEPIFTVARRPEDRQNGALVDVKAGLIGLASFSWLDSLIWKWFQQRLNADDVSWPREQDSCSRIVAGLEHNTQSRKSLVHRMAYDVRHIFAVQVCWAVLGSTISYVPALIMQTILSHVEARELNASTEDMWFNIGVMLVSGIVYAVADGQTVWQAERIKLRVRNIVVSSVYQKIMKRPVSRAGHDSKDTADDGTISNLISSDADKIADAAATAYEMFTSVPIRVGIALYLLYQVLGLSALSGIGIMLAITPVNTLIFKFMGKAVSATMSATDARVHETSQFLRHVRMIKLFAWEEIFENKLLQKRTEELEALRSRLAWWSVMATLWYIVPSLITFASFFTHTAIRGKTLLPSTAFAALALFNMLKAPLDQFVGMSAKLQESLLSVLRVESLLNELDTGDIAKWVGATNSSSDTKSNPSRQLKPTEKERPQACGFANATLSWNLSNHSASSALVLRNLNLSFSPGTLNIIAGPTGSGKSSLLLGLMGELAVMEGSVHRPEGNISYCAQEAWLMNDTIKANILFGAPWDAERYKATLQACALATDLATFEAGDEKMAGEKGSSLSGGQRQRVALARAIYADSDCVLLDDCLSAVDSHTARWLVEKCLRGPLMAGRTCIMVTHSIPLVMPHADTLTILSATDSVAATGNPTQLKSSKILHSLLDSDPSEASDSVAEEESGEKVRSGDHSHRQETTVEQHSTTPGGGDKSREGGPQVVVDRPPGHIPFSVLMSYLTAMGGRSFWISITVLFTAQQLVAILVNWWLREFANAYSQATSFHSDVDNTTDTFHHFAENRPPQQQQQATALNLSFYLGTYLAVLVLYAVVNFGRLHAASLGSLSASKILHHRILDGVLHARLSFFDLASHGTLMRGFTSDINTIDNSVMPMALGTLHFLVMTTFTVALIGAMILQFLIPGSLMMLVYLLIGRLFLDTSRELERIKADAQAPLLQHVSESLLGVATIRAFGSRQIERFAQIQYEKLDTANRPSWCLGAVDRWLAWRLNVTGSFMSFIAGYYALKSIGTTSPGNIGLMLTYTMTFSENIMWMVRYHALNQQNFAAVERIQQISECESETQHPPQPQPSETWPSRGAVVFRNYSTRYRADLPLVLKNVNFEARPGQHIGVIGRTGAGKSTLALTILRGLEAESGCIEIDGVDVAKIDLHALRRRICLVPQDPALFEGDLRGNLDPFADCTDAQIRKALADVGLVATNSDDTTDSGGDGDTKRTGFADLGMKIEESGSNVSLSQRQLICLARALLRSPRLVIFDEATASIDLTTDALIRKCVANLGATVITIAHRLTSIIGCDQVVVMDNGAVVQYDTPNKLIKQEGGVFHRLCADQGVLLS